MAREILYNWSLGPTETRPTDPDYRGYDPYCPPSPLRALGNIQYLQMLDLIKVWWEGAHPEIIVSGIQGDQNYDPDKAYILHTMLDRRASDRTPKPKLHKEILDSEGGQVYIISTMSFVNIVQFTAVHRDPKIADRIIEEFQSFILFEATPILKGFGIEDIRFGNRMRDGTVDMKGEDLSARNVTFRVVTQEVLYSTLGRLQEIWIQATTHMYSEMHMSEDEDATPQYLFPDRPGYRHIKKMDIHATPSIPGVIETIVDEKSFPPYIITIQELIELMRRATDPDGE